MGDFSTEDNVRLRLRFCDEYDEMVAHASSGLEEKQLDGGGKPSCCSGVKTSLLFGVDAD